MVTGYKLTDGTITKRLPHGHGSGHRTARGGVSARLALRYHRSPQVEDLPQEARDYVEYLEKAIGCKITYISVGAEREATSITTSDPRHRTRRIEKEA